MYPVTSTISDVFCRGIRRPPYGCLQVIDNNENLMDPNDPSYDFARKHKILREDSPISQILPSLQRIYGASLEVPRIFLPPCPKSLAIFDHHCCRFHILFQFITRRYKWERRKVEIVSHLYNIFEITTGSSIQSHPESWREGSDTQFTGFFKPTPNFLR